MPARPPQCAPGAGQDPDRGPSGHPLSGTPSSSTTATTATVTTPATTTFASTSTSTSTSVSTADADAESSTPPPAQPADAAAPFLPLYIQYQPDYEDRYLQAIQRLVAANLSEPYSVPVYRFFLYEWGEHCFLAFHPSSRELIGVIICRLATHRRGELFRGYIAMLVVDDAFRGNGIGSSLVRLAIDSMRRAGANEIMLETEVDNEASLAVYARLGFIRTKRLHRYYLNGKDAFRLVLGLSPFPVVRRLSVPGRPR